MYILNLLLSLHQLWQTLEANRQEIQVEMFLN